jgi:hypothetical protein
MTWRISGSGLYNAFTTTSDSPALARCCATSSYATRSLPSRQLFASAFVVHVQRHGGDTDGSAVRDVEREPLGGGGGAHGGAHGGGAMSLMGGGGGATTSSGGGESCEKRMLSLLASTPTHKDRVKGLLATLDFEVGWQCRFHIL